MNFLRGVPYWSVAVALVVDGRLMAGITYDPLHDELYTARRGGGRLSQRQADPCVRHG